VKLEIDKKYLLTGIVVLVAVVAVLLLYRDCVENPRTRDGQVHADVIQITPRVSGPLVKVAVKDNQFVKAGDLLFEIDPRTFEASLEQAKAQYEQAVSAYVSKEKQVEQAKAQVEMASASVIQAESGIKQVDSQIEKSKAELGRQQELLPRKATSQKSVDRAKASYDISVEERIGAVAGLTQAKASLTQAEAALAGAEANLGAPGDANADLRAAQAAVRQAELSLEFTRVTAPVDGYITNLKLREGSNAAANQPAVALVDVATYRVYGFLKETRVGNIQKGDEAVVTLMSYPDRQLKGSVASLGWGIAQQDGSTGTDLLPNVSPTFEWIRLAQRVPVLVHLADVPEDIKLRVGTTCSILIRTGESR